MPKIRTNFFLNGAYQVLNVIVPLVTTPYLARTIGAEGNGVFTYTQAVVNYFVLFAMLGISSYGVRAIAEVPGRVAELKGTGSTSFGKAERLVRNGRHRVKRKSRTGVSSGSREKAQSSLGQVSCSPAAGLLKNDLVAVEREVRSRVFSEIFVVLGSVGLVILAAYGAYIFFWGAEYRTIWILWGFWLLGVMIDPTWLFFGVQEFKLPTIRSCLTRIGSVFFILIAVRDSSDVWAYVLAIAAPFFLNSILTWPFVYRYVDFYLPRPRRCFHHLRGLIALFLPVVGVSLYTILSKVLLGSFAGMGATGLYDYAEKTVKMPMAVVAALGTVMLPRMALVLSKGVVEEARTLMAKAMWVMMLGASALAFGIVAVAQEFTPFFLGEQMHGAVVLMQLLAITIPLLCFTNVIGVQFLVPSHREREYTLSISAGAVVSIVLCIALIPHYGAIGAAWATVGAEFAVAVIQVAVTRGDLNYGYIWRLLAPLLCVGALMGVVVRGVAWVLEGQVALGIAVCLEMMAGAIVYLGLLWFWLGISTRGRRLASGRMWRETFPMFTRHGNSRLSTQ